MSETLFPLSERLLAQLATAGELQLVIMAVRRRAHELTSAHFLRYPRTITSENTEDGEPLIEDEVRDGYGDDAELIALSAEGYTARSKETDEHSDQPYYMLDLECLLQAVAVLEEHAHDE